MSQENLLPGFESDNWRPWSPSPALAPGFQKEQSDGAHTAAIAASRFEHYGKWLCDVPGIAPEQTYRFDVEYQAQGISHESVSLHCMLTWRDASGTPVTRDYACAVRDMGNGWKSMGRTLEAPEKAEALTVELACKWTDAGSVTWRNPVLKPAEPVKHRIVKVASAFIEKTGTLEGNLNEMLAVIDKAGEEKSDIVCLGETVYDWGVGLPLEQRAVTIPGPVTDILAERARKHNIYIVLSINEKEGDRYYNTGLLIDRNGGIAGKYRKMQLPLCEGEDGFTPGRDYPVFDTDFGRIGILICWDHGFPEVSRMLALQGAEILFLPTLWHSEIQAPARAVDNGVYLVVSAPRWTKTPCRVFSPEGAVIASAMGMEYSERGLCTATIDLDKRYYTFWCSVGAAYGEAKSCYMLERRCDTFGALGE